MASLTILMTLVWPSYSFSVSTRPLDSSLTNQNGSLPITSSSTWNGLYILLRKNQDSSSQFFVYLDWTWWIMPCVKCGSTTRTCTYICIDNKLYNINDLTASKKWIIYVWTTYIGVHMELICWYQCIYDNWDCFQLHLFNTVGSFT